MPPPRDHGKKAVGKRLEDDELFKQIGGQLDANFDYSQWQRTAGKASDVKQTVKREPLKDDHHHVIGTVKPSFTVSHGAGAWAGQLHRGSSADDVCHHGKPKRNTTSQAYDNALAKKKAEQIKILNLRIRARKQTIAEYRKREAELLLLNMKTKEEIMSEEKEAHEDVKKLLRKYEKYRGGINTLNDQFVEDLSDAKLALDKTRSKVDVDLSVLQKQVDAMDERLTEKQTDLHILMNYKDKEYPVKSLRISELKTEIAELEINQQEEENELQHIVDTELDKFKREENRVRSNITEGATEEVLARMHPSLKDMAMQNMVMEKEIEFHKKEIVEFEQRNKTLDHEVKRLLRDPKTSIRQQMFPEFYPLHEKCTPDMEVVLDIPVQEWLPI